MRIKIAARKSDLARLQAYRVGQALQGQVAGLEVEYLFSTSLGDQNLETPLWQMPEKGVFTEDLTKKLMAGECDLVVHSWKDLPTEDRVQTEIVATLPRADARDLILFRESSVKRAMSEARTLAAQRTQEESVCAHSMKPTLQVFSSSPRRILNVGEFLAWALPFQAQIEFKNIRGNIPTRVRKLMSGDADALVLAKAAVDRLLASPEEEFSETRQVLRSALSECRWMITPLTVNPNAPAQGALAIEILKSREDLREILNKINCPVTFKNAERERQILKKYGGGCHQKIGVACLSFSYGDVEIERGEKPAHLGHVSHHASASSHHVTERERLDSVRLLRENNVTQATGEAQIFPQKMSDSHFYEREARPLDPQKLANRNLWVVKTDAWPENYMPTSQQLVWSAGLVTWQKLAKQGVWVNGSQESFGEEVRQLGDIATLVGAAPNFLKLSHNEAAGLSEMDLYVTYDLQPTNVIPDLRGKTQFYWASFSSFRRAIKKYPEIRAAQHACGPGHTYKQLSEFLGHDVNVFLSYQDWLKSVMEGSC